MQESAIMSHIGIISADSEDAEKTSELAVTLQRAYRTRRYRRNRANLCQSNSGEPTSPVAVFSKEPTTIEKSEALSLLGLEIRSKEEMYICASMIQALTRGKLVRNKHHLPVRGCIGSQQGISTLKDTSEIKVLRKMRTRSPMYVMISPPLAATAAIFFPKSSMYRFYLD